MSNILKSKKLKSLIISAALFNFLSLGITTPIIAKINQTPEMQEFVSYMEKQHGFKKEELTNLLSKTEYQQSIIDAITRPAEQLPWYKYQNSFVNKSRIEEGVKFWKQNRAVLDKAEAQFGVPPEIIIAIIGVESRYGVNKGRYNVIDALTTLAFNYPPRAPFFKKELEEFLVLTREENLAPLTTKGSYAGAMGEPQFIASSYRNFAIDFDNDGKRDLVNNTNDAIGSVANYFNKHGWKTGDQVIVQAKVNGDAYKKLELNILDLKYSTDELAKNGITPVTNLKKQKVGVYEFANQHDNEYWIGLNNFFVITRYNRSPNYAMAVYKLSQEIKAAKQKELG